jgi:predicted outer membrane lipoprotein
MKTILLFPLLLAIAAVVIVLAVILGDYGPWYFAWLVGTVMMVLVAAAGGALLDAQERPPEDP